MSLIKSARKILPHVQSVKKVTIFQKTSWVALTIVRTNCCLIWNGTTGTGKSIGAGVLTLPTNRIVWLFPPFCPTIQLMKTMLLVLSANLGSLKFRAKLTLWESTPMTKKSYTNLVFTTTDFLAPLSKQMCIIPQTPQALLWIVVSLRKIQTPKNMNAEDVTGDGPDPLI